MLAGLFLFALGIVLTINANIGYAPWDVLHAGMARQTGLSIGVASIAAGLVILVLVMLCKEKLGLGTIANMILIGVFMDMIIGTGILPVPDNLAVSIAMLVAGLFVVSLGSYCYMKSAFGAGPRDSLMVLLARVTKLPVGLCRGIVELTVTLFGWLLGGMIGVGTVISGFAIGFCIQITFAVCKFDATAVEHETLGQTFRNLRKLTIKERP
jgi:uncharacterized membrane protein YczE